MPIRYKCEDCGSVLKIKEELAGTDGRCPKCKREFVVPAAGNGAASPAEAPAPEDDPDFDPVAFLMDGGGEKPSGAAPATASDKTAAPEKPRQSASSKAATTDAPPERPKRSRAPTGESAAESAGAMLGGTASSNAKHLLTRSMEESRVRAAEMPEEEEGEPGVDYSDLIKLILTRILPAAVGVIVLCVGLYLLSSSWFGTKLPELGRVSGVVTRSGEPLAGAQVTFSPLDIRESSATAITDDNGEYTLYYQEGIPGAVVGKNQVHIFAMDANGRELIEPRTPYGMGSNEIWVVESGRQEINIDTDKPAPPPGEQMEQ